MSEERKILVPGKIIQDLPGNMARVRLEAAGVWPAEVEIELYKHDLVWPEEEPEEKDVEMAIRFLSRYKDAERELRDIEERREALLAKYALPSAIQYSGMPKAKGPGGDLSVMSVKLEEYEQDLAAKYSKLLAVEKEIYDAVEQMTNSTSKLVLKAYYIDGKPWREIADMVPCTQRTVYKHREKAIKEIIKIIKPDI